ncbi:MAG TPA: hypothetical protein PKW80_04390 [Bacteroidales bacterium]|nr:hypothetical protein [Bacteroidales bacterium]
MKTRKFFYAAMFVLAGTLVLAVFPIRSVSQHQIARSAKPIPEDVAKILKKSCNSCHDAGSSGMAKSIWSFSDWDTYPEKKQAKKSNAICKSMTSGSMPPAGMKKSDPDKIPTKTDTEIVCKWAASLALKK